MVTDQVFILRLDIDSRDDAFRLVENTKYVGEQRRFGRTGRFDHFKRKNVYNDRPQLLENI